MDPNQQMPPSSPMSGVSPQARSVGPPMAGAPAGAPQSVIANSPQADMPHRTNNPNDLYAQITAEDEEVVVAPKKKTVPLISFMAVFMKATFWLDGIRHSHERVFVILGGIWAAIMGILYLSGAITLFLSVFSFMQLPVYLEKYFAEKGIQYDSLEMEDYSFSKIKVINLKDQNGTYNIPSITVHSTFADFLQNRIRMVEASDVIINIKATSTEQSADFDLITNLLRAFSEPKQTGLELDVNTIKISNAQLNIQGKNHTIPVPFSLSGTYMDDNLLVVKFSVDEDFLKIDASLEINGPEDARQIEIKTNKPGSLTLPQRPTEEIQKDSKILVKMANHQIQTIESEIRLNYAYSLKNILLNMENDGQGNFDGVLSLTAGDSSDSVHISALSTDVSVDFKGLKVDSNGVLKTDEPLTLKLRRLIYKNTQIDGMEALLEGNLLCHINHASCAYTLKEKTSLRMEKILFNIKGEPVQFSQNPTIVFLPTEGENITLQLFSPYFKLKMPIEKLNLSGEIGERSDELTLSADSVDLQMTLAQNPADTHLQIAIQNADYLTSALSMNHIDMLIDDYFDATAKIQFSASSVQTESTLLKKPVSLTLANVGTQTALQLKIVDTNVIFNAQGSFDPFKYSFSGRFNIPFVDLETLPFDLSELSSIFSKNISNLKGMFAASGQLKINGISSISGPFYIGLKDVGMDWEGTVFSGINGVIGLQSLEPLVTGNNQRLFIQDIQSYIPISNLLMQFHINNQSLRLSNASAQIANQDVIMTSALIPLKNPNVSLPLRTAKNFDLSQLDAYFDLSGVLLKEGEGSFNLPVNITEEGFHLGDLIFKITDGVWQKDLVQPDILDLFNLNDTSFTVRSGQLILNHQNQLQVALDGWRMPDRKKDSFGPEIIDLSEPLLKQSPLKSAPVDIQKFLNKFGM